MTSPEVEFDERWDAPLTQEQWSAVSWMFDDRADTELRGAA